MARGGAASPAIGPGDLVSLVAESLFVTRRELDVRVPLGRYGLDSLAAVELAAALEGAFARRLPETLALEETTIADLARLLESPAADHGPGGPTGLAAMLADSRLPADVRPDGAGSPALDAPVLLTGATGFLGGYLLRALLAGTGDRVTCLVRAESPAAGRARLEAALAGQGIWDPAFAGRLDVVCGDVGRPRLGLSEARFDALGRAIRAVYHCAARVNWVASYAGLREVNVRGTLELLRLACRGPAKPFHFVSTLGVCYSTAGPREVSEQADMLPYLGGIHLGYAQSKCVAEALVRRAAERGLPAAVYRPALIAGDTRSGASNTGDFLSSLLKGCIQMGCAPDLDWAVDACPVDHVADAIVRLGGTGRAGPAVYHLASPGPRHWRECVLWLNLFGYPVRLVSYRDWLDRLEREPGHALVPLRGFFLARPAGPVGPTLPELYEEGRRSHTRSDRTRRALLALGAACPPLDARLLDRYVSSFIARGFLPPVAGRGGARPDGDDPFGSAAVFEPMIIRAYGDERLRVRDAVVVHGDSEHSILTELASWRYGRVVGLRRYRLAITGGRPGVPETLDVMVKVKPEDSEVLEVGERVARLCGEAVGRAYARFKDRLGVAGCHRRELAVYGETDERFRRHAPACYGAVRDDGRRLWALVLEHLGDAVLMDTADDVRGWRPEHVAAAVGGLAEVHAIWYGREAELRRVEWLAPVSSAADMAEAAPLWAALAEHAAGFFAPWLGDGLLTLQRALVADVGAWWRPLEGLPRTLVHGDFNPRNVALRRAGPSFRLCAYDWELAGLGVPQRDLAEFLCFVLGPNAAAEDVHHYLELHRTGLERAAGRAIDRADWRLGFRLSLDDLLLNRLAVYALVHTFRRQAFLERVLRTWWRLRELCREAAA